MEKFIHACSLGSPEIMGNLYGYPYNGAYIEGVSSIHEGCIAISPIWRIMYDAFSSNGDKITCIEYIELVHLPHLFVTPTNSNFESIIQFLRQGLMHQTVYPECHVAAISG